mmetsp:Transcript_29239/g.44226  ORF Transcript_29239/g.44226 Transcript_29239/m.44226 type:complete len:172 (-) Transcript_29239:87-602(-)
MGIFGKQTKDTGVPSEPGAYQIHNGENLPVAVPIEATVVATAPPGYGSATTTTTTSQQKQHKQKQQPHTTTTPQQQKQPTPVVVGNFRRHPVTMEVCPFCQQRSARTKTRTYPNIWTWLLVILVGVVFFPLFWIPLCCECFKQTDHHCKSCGAKVGTVRACSQCCETRRGY